MEHLKMMQMKRLLLTSPPVSLLMILCMMLCMLCCISAEAVTVPVNGGFERADGYSPVGWDVDGPWLVVGNQKYEGRRCVALNSWETLAGDSLTSRSGMVVRPGHEVVLNGFYRGAGLGAALELVDLLGECTAQVASADLPEAADWTAFCLRWQPPAEWPEGQFAYVRASLLVLQDGAEGGFDAVIFDEDGAAAAHAVTEFSAAAGGPPASKSSKPEKPPIPPLPPNLVQNPELIGGEQPRGWSRIGPLEQTDLQAGRLSVTGGDDEAGWHGQVERMDLSVPHRLSLRADLSEVESGDGCVVVAITDPTGGKLYQHLVVPVGDGGRVEATIEPVDKLPMSGRAQISLLALPELAGALSFTDISVRPDPHLPTVNARQPFAIFTNPAQVSLFVQVPNHIDQVTELLVHLKVADRLGESVSYEKRQMAVAPRAVALFPAGGKVEGSGSYTLAMRVETSDGSRTLAYGEYPFVAAQTGSDAAKNLHFGVALPGQHMDEIAAAAATSAGWVAVPLDYTEELESRAFVARLRTVGDMANQARARGLSFAVQLRLPEEAVPGLAEFSQFFRQADTALGYRTDAYVLEPGAGTVADAESASRVSELAASISEIQTALWAAPKSIVVAPSTSVALAGATADGAAAMNEDDAGEAGEPEAPADTTAPTAELLRVRSFAALTPDGRQQVWLPAVGAAADAGSGRLEMDAGMVRAALGGCSDGHQVVFWDGRSDGGILDRDSVATPCWVALWAMCRQLQGKSFVRQEPADDGMVCLRFGGTDGDTLVLWAEDGRRDVVLAGDLQDASAMDLGGQSVPLSAVAGRVQQTLTTDPLYVHVPCGAEVAITCSGPR
jgi:hypothetical protein